MAIKKYGYYLKGNRFAIAQEGSGSHCSLSGYNDKTSCEAAGGTWYGSASFGSSDDYGYKSPLESVTDGIEIEYTYAPIYRKFKDNVHYDNVHMASGWTVINGYVAFVSSRKSGTYGVQNWSAATAGSEGDTGGQSLDYIEVTGGSRWNGIHKVQTAGAGGETLNGGLLITYTKADQKLPVYHGADIDLNDGASTTGDPAYLKGDGSSTNFPGQMGIEVGDFIFVSGYAADTSNNGVFKVTGLTAGALASGSQLKFTTKYYFPILEELVDSSLSFGTEETVDVSYGASSATTSEDAADTNITLAKIVHESIRIRTDVDVLNDENDEIDLTPNQSRAVVYYVKGMMAEDAGDFEKREYFMRLFKKQLEKERSGRQRGPYVAMGDSNMRVR